MLTVEKLEAGNQRRRDDQGGVGVVIGVANDQAGTVWDRGREEVEIGAEARQHGLPSLD